MLTAEELKPDPAKVEAALKMPALEDKQGISRLQSSVQYLSKSILNFSQEDAPLREVLKSDIDFTWDTPQKKALRRLKEVSSTAPTMKYYDVKELVEIHCDATMKGLRAILILGGQPIAHTSRALTILETRYAQIEKETLSITHT